MRLRPLRDTSRPGPAAQARREATIATLAGALAAAGQGQPVRALEALASVVVNRMLAARARRAPAQWGVELSGALRAPGLFPTAAPGAAGEALAAACRRIAARAAAGALPDPTGGALWWHPADTPRPAEAAAEGGEAVQLGGLVFVRPSAKPGDGQNQG